MRFGWLRVALASILIFLAQCQIAPSKRPSVLVVAVESLPPEVVSCDGRQLNKEAGFSILCNESVRFTHAYTTSLMSQAAVASILTGLYPSEHGVFHNGNQFLRGSFDTSAEAAVRNGYRTSFFSGGAPILRKSGLNQGFETFDDQFHPSLVRVFRNMEDTSRAFKSWVSDEVAGDAFLSFFYFPDLDFENVATKTASDEAREKSYESQVAELDETLGEIFHHLMRQGRWENTNVILVGLNGLSQRRGRSLIDPINLQSEKTQVALFIKPAQKKRDQGIHWKIDKNVSLADVGVTLFDLVGASRPSRRATSVDVTSLRDVLDQPDSNWSADRIILVETAWPYWRDIGRTRVSARQNHHLVVFDNQIKVYNTLTDRHETMPLTEGDQIRNAVSDEAQKLVEELGYVKWSPPSQLLMDKINYGVQAWRLHVDYKTRQEVLDSMDAARAWEPQLTMWRADLALQSRNWKKLNEIGAAARRWDWKYVARKNLGVPVAADFLEGCHKYLAHSGRPFVRPTSRECNDDLFLDLVEWTNEGDESKKNRIKDRFLRRYFDTLVENKIAEENFAHFLVWDADITKPMGPTLVALYLALPEQIHIRTLLNKQVEQWTNKL